MSPIYGDTENRSMSDGSLVHESEPWGGGL
jgi:hypothetical protein